MFRYNYSICRLHFYIISWVVESFCLPRQKRNVWEFCFVLNMKQEKQLTCKTVNCCWGFMGLTNRRVYNCIATRKLRFNTGQQFPILLVLTRCNSDFIDSQRYLIIFIQYGISKNINKTYSQLTLFQFNHHSIWQETRHFDFDATCFSLLQDRKMDPQSTVRIVSICLF